MNDKYETWFQAQIEANKPGEAGVDGVVRLIDASLAMSLGRGMAFGAVLPERAEGWSSVSTKIVETVSPWFDTASAEHRRAIVDQFGAPELERLGLSLGEADLPNVVARLRVLFPVTVELEDDEAETFAAPDETLRALDGQVPFGNEAEIPEVGPFQGLDWFHVARMRLRYDEDRRQLVCEVGFESLEEATEGLLDEARSAAIALWGTSYALNLEWHHGLLPGQLTEDHLVDIFVNEDPLLVEQID